MNSYRRLLALATAGALLLAGCGSGDDDTAISSTTTTASTAADNGGEGGPEGEGGGGPGGEGGGDVDPTSIETEAELADMIDGSACGDGALDLHRGHMPIETILVDVLGISHDEMHVRMDQQGQNLAAVANDVGVGDENLAQTLTDHLSPAIDNTVNSGVISEEQAEEYQNHLEEAINFRVYWDGEQSPPEFCTAAT